MESLGSFNPKKLLNIRQCRTNRNIVLRHFADVQEILAFREGGHAPDLFVNVGEVFFLKVRSKITAENKVFIVNQMQQIDGFCQMREILCC